MTEKYEDRLQRMVSRLRKHRTPNEYCRAIIYQADVIERLRKPWVSVDERTPDRDDLCLVYNANEEWQGGIAEWSFAWYSGKKWVCMMPWTPDRITHWQYLVPPG